MQRGGAFVLDFVVCASKGTFSVASGDRLTHVQ